MLGQSAVSKVKITDEDIRMFSKLSGDRNPIHLDENYAKTTIFGQRIAHGMYVSSFISAVIANQLPGIGTIYLSQNLSFKAPVFIGDEITVKVEVSKLIKPGIYELLTTCSNQSGKIVIDGSAVVKVQA